MDDIRHARTMPPVAGQLIEDKKAGAPYRRRTWALLAAGAAVTLVFAWPLQGAIVSLAWPAMVYDTDGPDVIIAKRLIGLSPGIPSRQGISSELIFAGSDDCERSVRNHVLSGDEGFDYAWSAINRYRNWLDSRGVEDVELSSLLSLPRPVLGGLGGCVDASLAGSLCLKYVDQRLDGAVARSKAQILEGYRKDALIRGNMVCVLARNLDRQLQSRTPP